MRPKAVVITILLSLAPYAHAKHAKPAKPAKPVEQIAALAEAGIRHEVVPRAFSLRRDSNGPKAARFRVDNHALLIKLGKLAPEQFAVLKARYGNRSSVLYQADRDYELTDFLPPIVQATHSRQFAPIKEARFPWRQVPRPQDGSEPGVELEELQNFADLDIPVMTYTNCWTTAYEFWRLQAKFDGELDITWMGRPTALAFFTDNAISTRVPKGAPLELGDLVLYSSYDPGLDEDIIQHAAIHIDEGLSFEKTDTWINDAYRLVLTKDIDRKMTKLFGKGLRRQVRRLKADAVIPRLNKTLPLAFVNEALYRDFFAPADLASIAIEIEAVSGLASTQLKGGPVRVRTIELEPDPATGIHRLAPQSTLRSSFIEPLWK